jgi:U4/U6 small nuclear ribonucleoprotein PRP4
VWDLRSGKNILAFAAHAKQLTSLTFLPSGFQLATGSDDNTVKIWDLRKKRNVEIVLAHTKLVSDIKFEGQCRLMATASYDGKVKLWGSGSKFQGSGAVLLRTLTGHENKVTSVCMTRD